MQEDHDEETNLEFYRTSPANRRKSPGWLGPQKFVQGVLTSLQASIGSFLDKGLDRITDALDKRFANHLDENHQRADMLYLATTMNLSAEEQIEIIEAGRHADIVLFAAAQQPEVPVPVQHKLLELAFDNEVVMKTLARNPRTDYDVFRALAHSPSGLVKENAAATLGGLMPIEETDPSRREAKEGAFQAFLDNYDTRFSPYLVPVCRDEATLGKLYFDHPDRSSYMEATLDAFVQNPNTPAQVLLDIVSREDLVQLFNTTLKNTRREAAHRLPRQLEPPQPDDDNDFTM